MPIGFGGMIDPGTLHSAGPGSLLAGLYGRGGIANRANRSTGPVQRQGTAPYRTQGFQDRPQAPATTRYPFPEQAGNLGGYPFIDTGEAPKKEDYLPEQVHLTGSFPEGGQRHGVYSGALGRAKKAMYAQYRGYHNQHGMHADASDAQMERAMRQYFHGVGERRDYEDVMAPFLKEEMLVDWQDKQAEARYQNELRYHQLLNMQQAQAESMMGQLENVGMQQISELQRQGERLGGQALAGAYGSTNFGARQAAQRQMQEGLGQATRDVYGQMAQQRLGVEKSVTDQYMKIVEGRTDQYPSMESMASLMFNYGKSGVDQPQPQVQQAQQTSSGGLLGGLLGALFGWLF